jgi:hypothetical protein
MLYLYIIGEVEVIEKKDVTKTPKEILEELDLPILDEWYQRYLTDYLKLILDTRKKAA